jgi:hypothetical protein
MAIEIGKSPSDYRRVFVDSMDMSKRNRAEIAERMNAILGDHTVTKTMLDEHARPGNWERELRFPTRWLFAFCEATGSNDLLLLAMGPHLRQRLEIGERILCASSLLKEAFDVTMKIVAPKDKKGKKKT